MKIAVIDSSALLDRFGEGLGGEKWLANETLSRKQQRVGPT
jgi:hypothetical protein